MILLLKISVKTADERISEDNAGTPNLRFTQALNSLRCAILRSIILQMCCLVSQNMTSPKHKTNKLHFFVSVLNILVKDNRAYAPLY